MWLVRPLTTPFSRSNTVGSSALALPSCGGGSDQLIQAPAAVSAAEPPQQTAEAAALLPRAHQDELGSVSWRQPARWLGLRAVAVWRLAGLRAAAVPGGHGCKVGGGGGGGGGLWGMNEGARCLCAPAPLARPATAPETTARHPRSSAEARAGAKRERAILAPPQLPARGSATRDRGGWRRSMRAGAAARKGRVVGEDERGRATKQGLHFCEEETPSAPVASELDARTQGRASAHRSTQ